MATILEGDCLDVMKTLAVDSVDAIVTDPPYHLTSIVKRFGGTDLDAEGTNEARARAGADCMARLSRGFMGKQWDGGDIAQNPALWAEVLRVLKPGGHLAAFSGTRTYHRMACAIEDAGFEIRDQLAWAYGQGFPKSMDISKAIDKAARGVPQGGVDPTSPNHGKFKGGCSEDNESGRGFGAGPGQFMAEQGVRVERELVDAARQWEGWGTALKPAWEPICLARKPLSEKTVAANVLKHGVGALNINGCRVNANEQGGERSAGTEWCPVHGLRGLQKADARLALHDESGQMADNLRAGLPIRMDAGREEPELHRGGLLRQSDGLSSLEDRQIVGCGQDAFADPDATGLSRTSNGNGEISRQGAASGRERTPRERGEAGQLDREPRADRLDSARARTHENRADDDGVVEGESTVKGCTCRGATTLGRWPANLCHDGSPEVLAAFPDSKSQSGCHRGSSQIWGSRHAAQERGGFDDNGSAARFFYCVKASKADRAGSKHPTVKPVDLMQWLVRLITPPGGIVLDPFAGSGTTGEAAWREGMNAILIEREADSIADIKRRMAHVFESARVRKQVIVVTKNQVEAPGPLFSGLV